MPDRRAALGCNVRQLFRAADATSAHRTVESWHAEAMDAGRSSIAVLGLVGVVGACSFVSVRVPDRIPEDRELDCTTGAPIADTVIAALALVSAGGMVYKAQTEDARFGDALIGAYVGAPLGILGLGYAGSAIYGHVATHRCRRLANEQVAQRDAEASRRDVQEIVSELGKAAAVRAREGDCARALELVHKVRVIDRRFYDSVLVRDAAIARCLADSSD
jgi:hypothetical protein